MADEPVPLLDRYRWVILGITTLVVLGALGYLLLTQDQPVTITINPPLPTATHTPTDIPPPTETPAPLEVYVTGEVKQPESRISLPVGSRVEDAITAAGGATDNADLSRVNLAQRLLDGDQIHVPALPSTPPAEATTSTGGEEAPTPTSNAPRIVNLNTATQEELETLPGIGPATAQAIIAYREAKGGFTSVDELDEVEGIGEATLENLRGLVTVE